MKSINKLILGLIFGIISPLFLFMSSVVLWFYFFQEIHPLYFALSGVVLGLIIDSIYLKIWIEYGFDLPIQILVGTFLFYNVVIFGFFMGVPVFNVVTGIVAGYYFGNRLRHKNPSAVALKQIVRKVSLFTSSVMFLICSASAYLATFGEGAGKEIGSMLYLPFEVTIAIVWGIILIGGTILIIAQYFLTKYTLLKTLKFLSHF